MMYFNPIVHRWDELIPWPSQPLPQGFAEMAQYEHENFGPTVLAPTDDSQDCSNLF